MHQDIKFLPSQNTEFSKLVKKRVAAYFVDGGLSRYANGQMVFKTVVMLSLFFVPMLCLPFAGISSPWLLFALYMIGGLGKIGIGMGVMHDANHGSYARNKWINKVLSLGINITGGNARMWKLQHNVLHHTYTNIHAKDDDINTPFFLRFSPNDKRNALHRYQHVYAWFLYGLSTLPWATTKDFMTLVKYDKMGLLKERKTFWATFADIILWKVLYFGLVLVLPILFTSFPIWMILLAFLAQHFVTGLGLTLVFQLAHVVTTTDHPQPDANGNIEEEWAIHQMATTSNFAPKSRILSWLVGGLNYQVEHHLFPNICHIHYKNIAPIVKNTAIELGIPYLSEPTFFTALRSHYRMLKSLGRPVQ